MRTSSVSLAFTLVTIVLTAVSAGPAAANPPPWCQGLQRQSFSSSDLAELYAETDPVDALLTLVAASCFPDDESKAQAKQIAATRQAWSKKLDLIEGDWADVAAWSARSQVERNAPSIYPRPKLAWSAYSAIDQYGALANSSFGDSSKVTDAAYLADALGAQLTEVGKLAYIQQCLTSKSEVAWAMCQGDIDSFDAKKFASQLRADTDHDGYPRTVLRLHAYQLPTQLAEHAKKVKETIARDAAYGQLWKLADEARRGWSATDAKLIALMTAMDDARATGSRKATDGCVETTWAAWKAVVATIPAKKLATLHSEPGNSFLEQAVPFVLATADGYLASLALEQCAKLVDQRDYLTRVLGSSMARWPGHRGPRTATHTAALSAGITLDDRDARLEFPELMRPWIGTSSGSSGGGRGGIASAKLSGDTATITFAKVKGQQQVCVKGHRTNRITQIRSDGTLVYEYVCTAEKTEHFESAPAPPQTVKARYAGGLKPGMYVEVVEDVVVVAYAKGGKAPASIVGISLK